MFDLLIHADWSANEASKRQMAVAERASVGWQVTDVKQVPPNFLEVQLFGKKRVLAGFDFPIGLPAAYGKQTGFRDFREALAAFGDGDWAEFYTVAEEKKDISIQRPFYPKNVMPKGSKKRTYLLEALLRKELDTARADDLRRRCEYRTQKRPAASPIFWTLGAKQVGKAAIDGWQHVIRPALERGARLWPFDGRLADLSNAANCVLCETYPAEAYGHISNQFPVKGKRKQEVRRAGAEEMRKFAPQCGIEFAAKVQKQMGDGFGPDPSGEDAYDALAGLLSMIAVVQQHRDECGPLTPDELAWEGWIMGLATKDLLTACS
jgi:hypothetical protein